jgi:predicted RNA-binding protein with TRAM domain
MKDFDDEFNVSVVDLADASDAVEGGEKFVVFISGSTGRPQSTITIR